MPGIDLTFHPLATAELEAAFDWYLEKSERAATHFMAEIARAIESISKNPKMYAESSEGIRRCVVHRFPFLVVYRAKNKQIQVLAFAHGRRRPGYWIDRLKH
ncbi:MAG: type II toxin-antitoxin system RelE/ParE family toxin [Candidatus Korobacteraceae bacterium]